MAETKATRGQFFTVDPIVQRVMTSLVTKKRGRALEPSAGAGHLVKALEEARPGLSIDAIELDPSFTSVCQNPIEHHEFFSWADGRKPSYQVVFGNPPYVAGREMEEATRQAASSTSSTYPAKANLYYLFTHRAIDLLKAGGELVFIVPKEWLYTTTASSLREHIGACGALTHLVDCGEQKLFPDADVPALVIFRFVKGGQQGGVRYAPSLEDADKGHFEDRTLRAVGSRWLLLTAATSDRIADWGTLGDRFSVKVGLVSGLDSAYRLAEGSKVEDAASIDLLTTTRHCERYVFADYCRSERDLPQHARRHLRKRKAELLARGIRIFHEKNWWQWGAVRNLDAMRSETPRLYALAKTRSLEPFFASDAKYFSGGVLGLFARGKNPRLDLCLEVLNSALFREVLEAMMLASGERISLQPSTLEDAPFPRTVAQLRAALR